MLFPLLFTLIAYVASQSITHLQVDDFRNKFISQKTGRNLNKLGGEYGIVGENVSIEYHNNANGRGHLHLHINSDDNYFYFSINTQSSFDLSDYSGLSFDLTTKDENSDFQIVLICKDPTVEYNYIYILIRNRISHSISKSITEFVNLVPTQKVSVNLPFKSFSRNIQGGMFDFKNFEHFVFAKIHGNFKIYNINLIKSTPIQPIEPIESIQSIESIESIQSIQSIEPIEPIQHIQPTKSAKHVEPLNFNKPIKHVELVNADNLNKPVKHVEPANQIKSIKPVKPVKNFQVQESAEESCDENSTEETTLEEGTSEQGENESPIAPTSSTQSATETTQTLTEITETENKDKDEEEEKQLATPSPTSSGFVASLNAILSLIVISLVVC